MAGGVTRRVSDVPEWGSLLQEFDAFYRHCTDSGSTAIRNHAARVCALLDDLRASDAQVLSRTAVTLPVVQHLEQAITLAAGQPLAGLALAIGRVCERLTWEYGYADVPAALAQTYAYCELIGPQGPVLCPSLTLGLVLFAPSTFYPQHSHKGIEESYISISGRWSQNDAAINVPGSLVFNPPETEHFITTGTSAPCLLGYAWIGAPDRLAAPGMVFS